MKSQRALAAVEGMWAVGQGLWGRWGRRRWVVGMWAAGVVGTQEAGGGDAGGGRRDAGCGASGSRDSGSRRRRFWACFYLAARGCGLVPVHRNALSPWQDAVTVLLARTTAQLQAVEQELAEERVKLEYTEEEILEMERKEEQAEAASER